MAISFNNIPTAWRVPGVHTEIDNSRALQSLVAVPHVALVTGQKITAGSVSTDTLVAISNDGLADGYFGPGSQLARLCNAFKENNPYTELYAVALSDDAAGTTASGRMTFSGDLSTTGATTLYLMINGEKCYVGLNSAWSCQDIISEVKATVNGSAYSHLPLVASVSASNVVIFSAVNNGDNGNYINFRLNYYDGQTNPLGFTATDAITISTMEGGANNPDLGDLWTVIENERFNYIVQPYIDAANLTEIEDELSDRFGPMVQKQGHGFTAVRATQASATTLGNTRNSPHNTIIAFNDSPDGPEEWAAALGGVAAFHLNNDPARPLHFLQLDGILPPPQENRFTASERNTLLYDGISTFTISTGGKVQLERIITTYQANALGLPDPSYLDVNVLATLSKIRDQYNIRMSNRFLVPRFKLADDTFPVKPGSYVVTPKTIKSEIASLFKQLRDIGLIENLDEFVENLIVERDAADVNRVNVLLSPDLINQFRFLATLNQFIL